MRTGPALLAALVLTTATVPAADLVLVEKGVSKAPVVVPKDAPAATREAAGELISYIEKITGARPPLIAGAPSPTPPSAIWVGVQAKARELFPDVELDFARPEEILIAHNRRHLVIAGRDRSVGAAQVEHGTANAVYTFIQKCLHVRWLWPGPLGEDLTRRDTITISSPVYRYRPQFRQRDIIMPIVWRWYGYDPKLRDQLRAWVRRQRLLYDSLNADAGHAFTNWWEKYHKEHPDYFALHTDGNRGGFPGPRLVKLCQSNPKVWDQWLDNVAKTLKKTPHLTTFNGSPNDWFNSGICVCTNCRALDDPNGPPWTYYYPPNNRPEKYVAMSQRYGTFWNRLARGLKKRFPDRRLYVVGCAYGPARPVPARLALEANVIIEYCGHFPTTTESERKEHKAQFAGWARTAPMIVYRPNLWYFHGGGWGFPEVPLTKTIEDFRFLAENKCAGVIVDQNRSFWGVHGPEYYLMAQLTWNPRQDGQAVLNEYYRRAFGPAERTMRAYWALMEQATDRVAQMRDAGGSRRASRVAGILAAVYSADFLDRARRLLDQAAAAAAKGPDVYARRVAFVRNGFDVTSLLARNLPLMARVRQSKGRDVKAVEQALANWQAMQRVIREGDPFAIRYGHVGIEYWLFGRHRGMHDYFGPPSDKYLKAAGLR